MSDMVANFYDDEEIVMTNLLPAEEEDPRAILSVITDAEGVMHVYVEPATEGQTWRIWNSEIEGVKKAEIRFDPIEA